MDRDRRRARELARSHLAAGDALGWFEALYAQAGDDAAIIPWADLTPNPNLTAWLDANSAQVPGRVLEIGCGLGDDAEELARRGFRVTACDISATAIAWCRRRHPASAVDYVTADLFQPPAEWNGAFPFVVEAYTLQVLPPKLRPQAVRRMAGLLAPGGALLVIARGRDAADPEGQMPWPLTREEFAAFAACGLAEASFEDYLDAEDPPARRFRAVYRRPA